MLQTPEDFAAADNSSASVSEIVAYRPEWRDEDIALICGIANAGGGRIVVSSPISDRAKKMKRFKKPFERIPQLAWRELGLTCSTEPVMNGMNLCLEIQVPAAPHPIRYGNNYYLYNDGINSIVPRELFDRLLAPNIETPQAATEVTQASRDAQAPVNEQAVLQATETNLPIDNQTNRKALLHLLLLLPLLPLPLQITDRPSTRLRSRRRIVSI